MKGDKFTLFSLAYFVLRVLILADFSFNTVCVNLYVMKDKFNLFTMVGQADVGSSLYHTSRNYLLNQREVLLLTLGLINKPISMEDSHTMAKNLVIRMSDLVAYELPSYEVYRGIIQKLIKDGTIISEYSLLQRKHVVKLTESGEGEFDYLIHSIANKRLIQTFDEFRKLIDLFY